MNFSFYEEILFMNEISKADNNKYHSNNDGK